MRGSVVLSAIKRGSLMDSFRPRQLVNLAATHQRSTLTTHSAGQVRMYWFYYVTYSKSTSTRPVNSAVQLGRSTRLVNCGTSINCRWHSHVTQSSCHTLWPPPSQHLTTAMSPTFSFKKCQLQYQTAPQGVICLICKRDFRHLTSGIQDCI